MELHLESFLLDMFSSVSNASKFINQFSSKTLFLKYSILDVQFINNHLKQFGAFEITQDLFKKKISEYINHNIDFQSLSVKDEDLFNNVLTFTEIKETS